MWVEKNIDVDGEYPLTQDIPTADSLKLKSRAEEAPGDPPLPESRATETRLRRDDWMLEPETAQVNVRTERGNAKIPPADESLTDGYGDAPGSSRNLGGGVDFFSSLGTERVKKPPPNMPNPDELKIHSKELNTQLKEGKSIDEYSDAPAAAKTITPGGPGSQWRMMRLRRVFETVEEEGRPLEEVAQERFGSLEAFEQAQEERRILDERGDGQGQPQRGRDAGGDKKRGQFGKGGERGFMFNEPGGSGMSSRSQSFKRPAGSGPTTPSAGASSTMGRPKYDSMRISTSGQSTSAHTPVPTVLTPQPASSSRRAMSPSSLNKLQAKVLRAKLMGAPDAEKLEKEYESEMAVASGDVQGGVRTRVEMLPTLDAQGRLYDVGQGKNDAGPLPGNRKKKEKVETRDAKTGDIVRYNADDDDLTLGDLVKQERFGAGMSDQKDMDAQLARSIMTDNAFQNNLDYIDDNAEKLGRQKMRSDAMKRQFAINDYKRTQKALSTCSFCYGEDDSLPKAPVVATGTRAYLSCTTNEELVQGHCLIVPMQHYLSMLEADDDVWDEIRNFMKSLMRMFAEQDMGVVFYETVLSIKSQRHTVIECVPLPWEKFDLIPGYFKESILMSEAEWSQHKKLIDFSSRPGGFRRMMVPNLPYFMVQFDYKGEKGYGHVIEGSSQNDDPDEPEDEGGKGGGDFPHYFAAEILGNVLEVEPPGKWRRPRKLDFRGNRDRVERYKKMYSGFDWTGMLRKE
ncbi:hypothetical protein PENSPDRAFT_592720 [Peniophora sp. CONT]|nr:hypothetical protein PENSPDRAFT_592720 [Peniophora sp. CONT]